MDSSSAVDTTLVEAVEAFAALADPTRLRILEVLAHGTRCVCDLRDEVPIAANLLSYHLRVLREAGLLTSSRRGRWIDYAVDEAALEGLVEAVPRPARRVAGAAAPRVV
jgi:ArsR family transcriptional regulator, arsenate/arsenite/antimonite-responsive transcriptional repressor